MNNASIILNPLNLRSCMLAIPLIFATTQTFAVVASTPKRCFDVTNASVKHAMSLMDTKPSDPGYEAAYKDDFHFKPDPGTFIEHGNNKATLTGVLESKKYPDRKFSLVLELEGYIPPGVATHTPKYEEKRGICAEASKWIPQFAYYETFTKGTLKGVPGSFYDGVELSLHRMGPPFQMGVCASSRGPDFGASTWFTHKIVKAPAGHPVTKTKVDRGDLNLVLKPCAKLLAQLATFTATPATDGITVEWTSTSEAISGYNVWRGIKDAEGEYTQVTRLNNSLILPKGDATTGASYSLIDTTAEAGVTYSYSLESIDVDNNSYFYMDNMASAAK